MYAQEISASRFVELCLCVVVSETSPYCTRTLYFLKTSQTTFFFSPLTVHAQYFSFVALTNREWPNSVECYLILSTCVINSVYFSRGGYESLYMIFS